MLRSALLASLAGALAAGPALSTTWTVAPDSTGDFPNLFDAIAGADDGDVLLLTDGIFTGDGNRNLSVTDRQLTIRSQSGDPSTCILDPEGGPGLLRRVFHFLGTGPGFVVEDVTMRGASSLESTSSNYGGAVLMNAGSSPTFAGCVFLENSADRGGAVFAFDDCSPSFTGCTFEGNSAMAYGGAVFLVTGCAPAFESCTFVDNSSAFQGGAFSVWQTAAPTLTRCTFFGNSAPDGGAVAWCRWGGSPSFVQSILAYSTDGAAVTCEAGDGNPTFSCTDIYGNAGGDWVDCLAGLEGSDGNSSLDPLFCDPASGDFRLQWGSPCLPAHSAGCDRIGAFGAGNCASSAVTRSTWGGIKQGYR